MKNNKIYQHLMTGVSYFLPFVIGGGILTALAYLFDANNAGAESFGSSTALSAWLLEIGGMGMGLMFPIMGAYIAYSIADKPAILPGMIAGMLAREGGSGFIGAILAGFIAGYIVLMLVKMTRGFPRSLEGIKTLLIYPIIGLLLAALSMLVVNLVVEPIDTGLTNMLESLSGTSAILIGAIVGLMLAVDMGGPINKTAYLFAVSTLTNAAGNPEPSVIMAAAGSSAMVVSTSCAVAATLFSKKFSPMLRSAKTGAYIMGLSFFVEGAIPYVIAKPKKILPALIIGSAITGAITAGLGITLSAPIGGVETLPLVSSIPLYLLSFVIGTTAAVTIIYFATRNDEDYEVKEGANK